MSQGQVTGYLNLAIGESVSGKASQRKCHRHEEGGVHRRYSGEEWEVRMLQEEGQACAT